MDKSAPQAKFDLAERTANALAPGSVDTDLVRENPPEFVKIVETAAVLRRITAPDENCRGQPGSTTW